jgi:hypothetical protein
MKKLILGLLILSALQIISCSPSEKNQDPSTINNVPKIIQETNGWHVLGGQKFPLSISETPMQLQYENGHFTQSFLGQFYAVQSPNPTYDFARCNMNGDSVYVRQQIPQYSPFFYKEGDPTDVRYGVFWVQAGAYSSHVATGLHGIGPDALDTDTKLFDFPKAGIFPSSQKYFANPYWFLYFDPYYFGLKAYRIGTGRQIELGGFYENDYVKLNGIMGLDIDENYCITNPEHVKAYFASTNAGYSIWGHSPYYISFYTTDDINKTVFRDSTSQYLLGNTNTIVSCSDAKKVYYFCDKATDLTDSQFNNPRLLMFEFDKVTLKLTKKVFLGSTLSGILNDVVMIASKNQIFLNTNSHLYKLDLSNDVISDITPAYRSGTTSQTAITTYNNKLYAIVGSGYSPGEAAVTNVIYYE